MYSRRRYSIKKAAARRKTKRTAWIALKRQNRATCVSMLDERKTQADVFLSVLREGGKIDKQAFLAERKAELLHERVI